MGRVEQMRERKKRPKGRGIAHVIAVIGIIVAIVAVVGVVGGWWWIFQRAESSLPAGDSVVVEIEVGSSTSAIAKKLAALGVVRNSNQFRLSVKSADADGKLEAGTYQMQTGMADGAAIEQLLAGPPVETYTVTIPEGWRIEQMAARFEEKAGIPQSEFLALARSGAKEFAGDHPYLKDAYQSSLEGYLFPKTYTFEKGASARDVIKMMLEQFDKEIATVDLAYAKSKNLTLPDVVNIAAIIERETRLPKERKKVASVIYNRLKKDMRLQMCSTVVYVLNKNEMRLTLAETQTESPYNTYLHAGLPPGPIASPGLASLEAAADPHKSDYIYYVLTGKDGSHTFASTNEEFLRAKAKSKQVLGE